MYRKGALLFVLISWSLGIWAQKTSASKPASKAPEYIMHVVKFGETLTKIAQKYEVTKTDILKNNPSLIENSIFPEQIIRIPNIHKKQVVNNAKPANIKPEVKNTVAPIAISQANMNYTEHMVEPKQTLYGISKMYNVTIDDLKKWNNLLDNNVKIGTVLRVSALASSVKVAVNPPVTSPLIQVVTETPPPVSPLQEEVADTPEKPDIQAIENESQKSLLSVYKSYTSTTVFKGTGAPMTTTLGAMESVYFVMHKTLPIGTVIKVKNLVNNKIIYAKVIGTLPETDENKHVIIRYSMGVKKELQLQNGKCYVQIEYPK